MEVTRMQAEARLRNQLRAELEGIQHRLAALDDPNANRGRDSGAERLSLETRLKDIRRELDPLNEWFDRLPPDERPT
jgi:hypothetical protein